MRGLNILALLALAAVLMSAFIYGSLFRSSAEPFLESRDAVYSPAKVPAPRN